ncbi:MAG: polymer-forming cytoskeletal protein [Neomegalonema sp.]|nr:polymer-forming cytoskeletal protein [Neomegalonema sp.]
MSNESIKDRMANMRPTGKASVIQKDLVIKGAVLTDGDLEIHGIIEGDVYAKTVHIGQTSLLRGDIVAERAIIGGDAEGRITAREVKLTETSRCRAEIVHERIAIEGGAEFEGSAKRQADPEAWAKVSETFEAPGVELTPDAAKAVEELRTRAGAQSHGQLKTTDSPSASGFRPITGS